MSKNKSSLEQWADIKMEPHAHEGGAYHKGVIEGFLYAIEVLEQMEEKECEGMGADNAWGYLQAITLLKETAGVS